MIWKLPCHVHVSLVLSVPRSNLPRAPVINIVCLGVLYLHLKDTSAAPSRLLRARPVKLGRLLNTTDTHCRTLPLRVHHVEVDSSQRRDCIPTSSSTVYHVLRTALCISRKSGDDGTHKTARWPPYSVDLHHVSRSMSVVSPFVVKPRHTDRWPWRGESFSVEIPRCFTMP